MFWTLHLVDCLCPFHFIILLEFCSVLSFGPCFFVASPWLPLCVCFLNSRASMSPNLSLGKMALYTKYPVGPSGRASLVPQAECSRCTPPHQAGYMHPPIVVEPWLLSVRGIYPQADQLQGLAVTTAEGLLCRDQPHGTRLISMGLWYLLICPLSLSIVEVVGWCISTVWICPLGALALRPPRKCRPRSAATCALPRDMLHELQSDLQMAATGAGLGGALEKTSCEPRLAAACAGPQDT